ncbi:MAG: NUDIX hydrolase [bacterium]|nr:NUDIX hydrolase [bacterium]MDZ4285299.1 NUDIX hydrolase [Candidatus Sungbacteria bacterium]
MVEQKQDFYHVSLKLLLKNSEGHVLILKAPEEFSSMSGFYDVPGGRIDRDEFETKLEIILRREVKEEIGDVDVRINLNPIAVSRGMIHASRRRDAGKEDIHIFYVFFEADFKGGDVRISDEHAGHEWVSLTGINRKKYFTGGILEGIEMFLAHP